MRKLLLGLAVILAGCVDAPAQAQYYDRGYGPPPWVREQWRQERRHREDRRINEAARRAAEREAARIEAERDARRRSRDRRW
jgi:hypothetical protein